MQTPKTNKSKNRNEQKENPEHVMKPDTLNKHRQRLLKFCTVGFCGIGTLIDFILIAMQIVGPADGSNYIVDYYGTRLTRLSITNQTYRKPHLSL
ncbi:TM2 domain-containing protein 1 [Collichthys lucidus]|uniref:TM2 domain-containing protein 1 n=1 Tax=Collichthys lucidus TaxID=240159 RepID=A0A4U5UK59_COLLU|nr:TM2 domain-containing protein 1 [Collichthys lucidus]